MKTTVRHSFSACLSFSMICTLGILMTGNAQDKISPRLDVAYYQMDSAVRYLGIKVRKKIGKRFEPIAGAEVRLFMEFSDETIQLGNVVSSANGEGKLPLSEEIFTGINQLDEYSFYAEISETDSLEEATEYLVIKPSRLRIVAEDSDSSISVILQTRTNGNWEPFEGAEVAVFIQRRFGKILVGEESNVTDENGAVELTFDTEIPGDGNGLLTLESAIEDNDELGNVYATTRVQWGLPLVIEDGFYKRTLWATRDKTPWWLLIFPNVMIAVVWGVIIYLIILIFKMNALSREVK
ncbi:MAG: hypothetical protein WD824_21130 [Cyclobacteriaceae bacterium]